MKFANESLRREEMPNEFILQKFETYLKIVQKNGFEKWKKRSKNKLQLLQYATLTLLELLTLAKVYKAVTSKSWKL